VERFVTGAGARRGEFPMELLSRFSDYFYGLPRNVRVSVLVFFALALTLLAVPKFDEELSTALVYMILAVVLFWAALSEFM
jgi:hypothetical protein